MLFKWAKRVPCQKIAKLYFDDANGFENIELTDEVGVGLYLRCESIIAVTQGFEQKFIYCQVCGNKVNLQDTTFTCSCGEYAALEDFHRSYKNKQLYGANALPVFLKFLKEYPLKKSYREKLLAIDTLIHSFHILHSAHTGYQNNDPADEKNTLGRPVSANLIEGSLSEIVTFLNNLTLSPSNEQWREIVKRANKGKIDGKT